jgi:hypothetical protein
VKEGIHQRRAHEAELRDVLVRHHYPLGLTRGPIRNSRPSWERSTSATRRASPDRCMAHQRSARSTAQSNSRGTASSRVLTASALAGRRAGSLSNYSITRFSSGAGIGSSDLLEGLGGDVCA